MIKSNKKIMRTARRFWQRNSVLHSQFLHSWTLQQLPKSRTQAQCEEEMPPPNEPVDDFQNSAI